METIEMFGRDAQLHAALRRRAPQIAASLERDGRNLPRVRVTYRQVGPLIVSWDGATYRWRSGPKKGGRLPCDAEEAADVIVEAFGAATPSPETESGS